MVDEKSSIALRGDFDKYYSFVYVSIYENHDLFDVAEHDSKVIVLSRLCKNLSTGI